MFHTDNFRTKWCRDHQEGQCQRLYCPYAHTEDDLRSNSSSSTNQLLTKTQAIAQAIALYGAAMPVDFDTYSDDSHEKNIVSDSQSPAHCYNIALRQAHLTKGISLSSEAHNILPVPHYGESPNISLTLSGCPTSHYRSPYTSQDISLGRYGSDRVYSIPLMGENYSTGTSVPSSPSHVLQNQKAMFPHYPAFLQPPPSVSHIPSWSSGSAWVPNDIKDN